MTVPASQQPELCPGTVVCGRYRLDQLVARGGMGAVWGATDLGLERPVALKFMDRRVAGSSELRARFEREAKAAARLRTPHVVQVFDHGVEGDLPYIVMELLEGEDLGTRLKRMRRIDVEQVTRVVLQAAKALKQAHAAGILHRDLKPQNVYLARSEEEEIVKLLDFGIAKVGDSHEGESTRTGELLGSPHYMSPEQARGLREIDHRSDLWSLAIIVYRSLTGRQPFVGEGVGDVIYRICSESVPPPSTLAPDLPPALDEFFQRALARDPADRFQTAVELAAAFVRATSAPGATAGAHLSEAPPEVHDPAHASLAGPTPAGAQRSALESWDAPSARVVPAARVSYVPTPLPSGTLAAAATDATPRPARPVSAKVLLIAASVAFVGILVLGLGGLRWRATSPEEATRAPARGQDVSPPADMTATDVPAGAEPPASETAGEPSGEAKAAPPPPEAEGTAKTAGSARPAQSAQSAQSAQTATPGKGKKKTDWGY